MKNNISPWAHSFLIMTAKSSSHQAMHYKPLSIETPGPRELTSVSSSWPKVAHTRRWCTTNITYRNTKPKGAHKFFFSMAAKSSSHQVLHYKLLSRETPGPRVLTSWRPKAAHTRSCTTNLSVEKHLTQGCSQIFLLDGGQKQHTPGHALQSSPQRNTWPNGAPKIFFSMAAKSKLQTHNKRSINKRQ